MGGDIDFGIAIRVRTVVSLEDLERGQDDASRARGDRRKDSLVTVDQKVDQSAPVRSLSRSAGLTGK
jgi:hypothetical protein